jgi:diguanylate cyclase (GGDEF)-like protein/PAS domain S-box-containing protein
VKNSRKTGWRDAPHRRRSAKRRAEKASKNAIVAARKAEDRLRAAIDAMPEGVVFLDEQKRYILWNERYSDIYARSADLFQPGAHIADTLRVGVQRGDYPESKGREEAWMAERLAKLDNPQGKHEQLLSDGRWIMIEERRMPDGCTIGLRVDVTEIKKKEESFRLLFEANPVPMFLYDAATRLVTKANAAACAHYGFDAEDLVGRSIAILDHPNAARMDRTDGVAMHRRADGVAIDVSTFSSELNHDGRPSVLLACVDVTERRRSEARLAHMARHDALTNLPNRVLFREQVEIRLTPLTRGEGFAVLLFDLDNFKGVNDTFGHSMGDLLLQQTAQRIQSCLAPYDIAARLGGDEFAVIHGGPDALQTIIPLVERIVAELKRPFVLDNQVVQIGASVGVARAPEHGADPERLLKSADLALYATKARGRGAYCFFEPEMDEHLQARRRLELDLRAALLKGELEVHYQPLIDIARNEMCGCEALLRWKHPTRGYVPPSEFVPIAEESGLIGPIGQFVLMRACEDAARWPNDLKVAVNLSPAQFRSTSILDAVMQALASSGLPASRLDLEITEALLLERNDATLSALNGVRALGVGISMDDFGTGYSSLIYLRNFPFTKIKIDKSFVRGLSESADSQAIVRAILSLAVSLGLKVLAEGVETEDDLAYLREAGCHEAQGFYFSKARPMYELFPNAHLDGVPNAPAPIDFGERRLGGRRRKSAQPPTKTRSA